VVYVGRNQDLVHASGIFGSKFHRIPDLNLRTKTVWGVHKQNFRFNLTLEDPRKYHERVQAWETDGNSVCDLVLLFLDMKVGVLKLSH